MENTKITKKEVLNIIVNAIAAGEVDFGKNTEAVTAYVTNEIALLEKKAEKAKARKQIDVITDQVAEALTDEFMTVAQIVEAIGDESITPAKAVYRLNALVEAGTAEKTKVKVDGDKGRKINAYKRV